ncbi:dCMP deaminase [Tepiditoga spiralis]|uniref:dCMP deaminase n=1 Tax=Tepiditoga spiralis TaxID=2108365 RepID=A0A7G1G6A9_9BACT|nr:deaminase [Tepiditoga spiralis]BBE31971.1 dCMP deaminase [Tepiditoga spiralis]
MDKINKWDTIYMNMTRELAKGSHCTRVKVGAMIVKDGRIISTGINGTPKGYKNCDDVFNSVKIKELGDKYYEKHHDFSEKYEIHAEQNALLFLARNGGAGIEGSTIYVTHSPCIHCAKMIANSGIKRVIFYNLYDRNQDGIEFLKELGLEVKQLK